MQIVKRRGETNGKHFTFGDLLDGDWFENEEGSLCAKIELVGGDLEEFNAIKLVNGSLCWFADDEEVRYYAGTVTIDADSFEEYTPKRI
jgi:hypothetical protein